MTRIEQAQAFAHEAHDSIRQKRKHTGEPYWVHTDAVAQTVAETVGATEDMIVAAHLHDVLEDVAPKNVRFSAVRIQVLFGDAALKMVYELTDEYTKEHYPKLNREARKELERQRVSKISFDAKTIKLADLIDNTTSIVEHDPDFAVTYLKEMLALLPCLVGGSPVLLQRASMQTVVACQKIGVDIPVIS